jgi:hypothetical protein
MKQFRCLFVLLVLFFFSGISLYAQDDLEITVDGESVTLDPGTTAAIAGAFGKGGGYGIGLLLLPVIFLPMLAFGSAQYVGGTQPNPAGDPLPDTTG